MTEEDLTSRLRPEDRPYVAEVAGYLRQAGLSVSLRGSAVERADYQDIDLLATGNSSKVLLAYQGLDQQPSLHQFPQKAGDGQLYGVERIGEKQMYLNTFVDQRFRVTVGNTSIDLSLKIDNEQPDDFSW